MKLLVTGSSGLIGSEVCRYFSRLGYEIHGVDNNQRKKLFGESGDTSKITKKLKNSIQNFNHHSCDIRERDKILDLFKEIKNNNLFNEVSALAKKNRLKITRYNLEFYVNCNSCKVN